MQTDEQEIRELVDKWLAATKAGNVTAVLRLMDEDVLFMVPGREPFGKDVFGAAAQAMKNIRIEGASEIQELKVVGVWAWMRNRLKMTITTPNGTSTTRSGHTLTILRKKPDGHWVIARDANLLA